MSKQVPEFQNEKYHSSTAQGLLQQAGDVDVGGCLVLQDGEQQHGLRVLSVDQLVVRELLAVSRIMQEELLRLTFLIILNHCSF